MPAPEFCPLGAVTWPPPEGAVVCAEAGNVTIASAIAPVRNLNMANSLLYDEQKPAGFISLETVSRTQFVPGNGQQVSLKIFPPIRAGNGRFHQLSGSRNRARTLAWADALY
jgi:hypothetical protein